MSNDDIHLPDIPIYPHTGAYAREHNELPQYRESSLALTACRSAIEAAIAHHFDGLHLDKTAVSSVMDTFGVDRTLYVLANTVQQKLWDGRFSAENRAWAQSIEIPDDTVNGFDRRSQFTVNSHPAILNGYIDMARREFIERGPSKRPSLRDQISQHQKSSAKQPSHPRKREAGVR